MIARVGAIGEEARVVRQIEHRHGDAFAPVGVEVLVRVQVRVLVRRSLLIHLREVSGKVQLDLVAGKPT